MATNYYLDSQILTNSRQAQKDVIVSLLADLSARQQSQHASRTPADGHPAGGAWWNGASLQPGIVGRAGHPLGDERGRARRRRQKGKRASRRRARTGQPSRRIGNRKRKPSEERWLERLDERGQNNPEQLRRSREALFREGDADGRRAKCDKQAREQRERDDRVCDKKRRE